MGEISLPASLPLLQRGLAVPTQTFQLANQTQLLPRAENQRLAARRPPRQELGCCLSLLSLLPQRSPGLPSITRPAGRSGAAPLTCLRFLRSPLFSRVHCFLSCMFQPCGNKTHGWLATRAGQMKQTLSLPLWQWRSSGLIHRLQMWSWSQMFLACLAATRPQGKGMWVRVDSEVRQPRLC